MQSLGRKTKGVDTFGPARISLEGWLCRPTRNMEVAAVGAVGLPTIGMS